MSLLPRFLNWIHLCSRMTLKIRIMIFTSTVFLMMTTNANPSGVLDLKSKERTCIATNTLDPCLNRACIHGTCFNEMYGSICHCDPGWKGQFCNYCCDLDCENGTCMINLNTEKPFCNCAPGFEGYLCDEIKPTNGTDVISVTPKWYWGAVGSATGIALLLLVAMVTLPYYMWKKRVLLVMKIVYHFQRFEDDDEKLYDAFVSYRNSDEDEKFVHYTLYPKLEKELDFKLCLHQRDFIPGESIANNILNAVQNSRRSILVISPSYVNGEWPRFEYQAAQHEMLGMRHRVIPIMFKDIGDVTDIDPNLKNILSSVTYIHWPQSDDSKSLNKFWKKIALSMPKKRASEKPTEIITSSGDISLSVTEIIASSSELSSPSNQISHTHDTSCTSRA